ncbi:MAG: hypothetical protein BMS9Abin23_0531 [Thermodesulfobacteriota bacterium]|nr:MAG: hypothetical protein BMS9Abin23_0531 [Thermodesulfobacteriota bacterium]
MVLESCRKVLGRGVLLALALFLISGMVPMSSATAQDTGDAAIGERLYTGQQRLTNGGPPCITCHNVSYGALGGGTLGPDLTKVYANPAKNPLVSTAWINNFGSPVMGPIFNARPITEEEVANIRAFFSQQSEGAVRSAPTGTFVIVGLGGFIGILIVFNIIWSGRYRSRCKGTAHDALWRNYGGKGGR